MIGNWSGSSLVSLRISLNEFRIDVAAGRLHRGRDRARALIARQSGHQELAPRHRLGQTVEMRAVADEVGAHRQNDVYVYRLEIFNRQQQLHESGRFVAVERRRHGCARLPGPELREAKHLFELVDDDRVMRALRTLGKHRERFRNAEFGAAQEKFDALGPGVGHVVVRTSERGDCARQPMNWRAARLHCRPMPLFGLAGLETRQQPRANERGFACSRTPDDGDQPALQHQLLDDVDRLVSAEEKRAVAILERPEADERPRRTCGVVFCGHRAIPGRSRAAMRYRLAR